MSNIILVPSHLINSQTIKSLLNTYGKIFYVTPTKERAQMAGIVQIPPKVALKHISSEKSRSDYYLFSPEQFSTTLSACYIFMHQNVKYVISSFVQLVIGYYKCNVFIAKQSDSKKVLTCYRPKQVGVSEVLSTYIDELSAVPHVTANPLSNLFYETVVKQELHRVMTLQYYLRHSVKQCDVALISQVQERKKDLVMLMERHHA